MDGSLLVTTDETLRLLNIGRTTLYRLIQAGELQGVLIGHSRRFRRDEIAQYIDRLSERATELATG